MNMNVLGSMKVSAICPHLKPWAVSYGAGIGDERGGRSRKILTLPMHPSLIVSHSLQGDSLLIPSEKLGTDRVSRHHEECNDTGGQRAAQG